MSAHRGRRVAMGAGAAGVLVLVAAGLALKDPFLEALWLHELERGGEAEKKAAAERLREMGSLKVTPYLVELIQKWRDRGETRPAGQHRIQYFQSTDTFGMERTLRVLTTQLLLSDVALARDRYWPTRVHTARLQTGIVYVSSSPPVEEESADGYLGAVWPAGILDRLGDRAIPAALELLRSPSWEAARSGCVILVRRGRLAVEPLLEIANAEPGSPRLWALRALDRIGDPEPSWIPSLGRALEDASWVSKGYAAKMLRSIGPPARSEVLRLLVATEAPWEDGDPTRSGLFATFGLDRAAWKALLLGALGRPEPSVRATALRVLGRMENRCDVVLDALAARMTDEEPSVRKASCWALSDVGGITARQIPLVLRGLEGPDEWVRTYAPHFLRALGAEARETLPALRRALEDPVDSVRFTAGNALKAIEEAPPGRPLPPATGGSRSRP